MTFPPDSLAVNYLQAQDSLLERMIAHPVITGVEGVPLSYQIGMDDGITCVVLLSFFIFTYVLSGGRHFLSQQIQKLFSTRERSNLFSEETNVDFHYRLLLLLNTCIVVGLLIFEQWSVETLKPGVIPSLRGLGIYIGLYLGYYVLKYVFYAFINWVFFDKYQQKMWLEVYFWVFVLEGLLLFPLLLLVVYFDLGCEKKLFFIGLILLLGKIMLFYQSGGIFFKKIHRAFYLIVYFCALEIVPCFILGRTLISINSLL